MCKLSTALFCRKCLQQHSALTMGQSVTYANAARTYMHSHFDGTFAVIGDNICFLEGIPLSTILVDFVLQSLTLLDMVQSYKVAQGVTNFADIRRILLLF